VPNVVNLAKKSPATHLLVVRHNDRVGVLSAVFGQLKHAGISVQETENVVLEGGGRRRRPHPPRQRPAAGALDAMRAESPDVIELSVLAR
jgi:D-3-phosphoglycerate dehydrogenase